MLGYPGGSITVNELLNVKRQTSNVVLEDFYSKYRSHKTWE